MKLFKYLAEIFFPSTCIACGHSVHNEDVVFCAGCMMQTVFTSFPNAYDNEMTERLISIKTLQNAYAPLFYKKNTPIANLFYRIKYGNRPDLAEKFALYLSSSFQDIPKRGPDIDAICYVPIHDIKLSKRGYNQSRIIARTLGDKLSKPVLDILKRTTNIETQTHFGRLDRLKNQEGSIHCDPAIKKYHHVLIIDDILTTGATIEICCDAILQQSPYTLISILTLAVTDNW